MRPKAKRTAEALPFARLGGAAGALSVWAWVVFVDHRRDWIVAGICAAALIGFLMVKRRAERAGNRPRRLATIVPGAFLCGAGASAFLFIPGGVAWDLLVLVVGSTLLGAGVETEDGDGRGGRA